MHTMPKTALNLFGFYFKHCCLPTPWTICLPISFLSMLHFIQGDHFRSTKTYMSNGTKLVCTQNQFRGIIEAAAACHADYACRAVSRGTIGNVRLLALCQCMTGDENVTRAYGNTSTFLKINGTFNTGRNYLQHDGMHSDNFDNNANKSICLWMYQYMLLQFTGASIKSDHK